jgi:hypothetical protein
LGFDYQFSDGETFSLFRPPLLFPALVLFMKWCKREVLTIHDGTRILNGHLIFAARNRTAFAYPGIFGVSIDTAFQDGTILLSRNYGDDNSRGPMIVINCCKKASISDTWGKHQERIAALEAEGKRVDRQTSFQFYAGMSYKETTFLEGRIWLIPKEEDCKTDFAPSLVCCIQRREDGFTFRR